MPLLLFDIDGTLLHVTGGVHQAVSHAVSEVAGTRVSTDGVPFSGRTDPAIFRDVLRNSGISEPDDILHDVIDRYVNTALDTIQPDHVELLPGVAEVLSRLQTCDNVSLGLLTGNVEAIAYHKLRGAGLDAHFSFGAFGSDHADRGKLPAVALRRASQETGHSFSPSATVIIGDTRHDIHCAQAVGARSVAVCTGRFDHSDLSPHTPDLLFHDLTDIDRVVAQLQQI